MLRAAVMAILAGGCGHHAPPLPDAHACAHRVIHAGAQPKAIVSADFNRDGIPDLATANWSGGSVTVLLGTGGGAFADPMDFATDGSTSDLIVGDFNGDGRADLAIAGMADANLDIEAAAVMLGNGDGTFQHEIPHFVTQGARRVAAADFDRDGKLDLVVAGDGMLLLGNGDGTFREAGRIAGASSAFAAADLDGDGRPDLAASYFGQICFFACDPTSNEPGFQQVLLGRGDGTFAASTVDADQYSAAVSIVDLDLDGRLDLVETTFDELRFMRGNGTGTFQTAVRAGPQAFFRSVVVADLDGDGRPDLAETESQSLPGVFVLWFLHGHGDGTFDDPIEYATDGEPDALLAADVDGDSRLDLVVATSQQDDTLDIFSADCFAP
jgi:hypothetical protein